MARRRKKIGEILVDWKIITQKALDEALAYAAAEGKRIGEALIELELCTEEDVTKALATQFDMAYVDLDRAQTVTANLHLIDEKIMKAHKVLPLGEENGRLKVVIGDPLDLETLDLLRFRLNPNLECSLAPPSKIKAFIDRFLAGDYKKQIAATRDSIDQDRPDTEEQEGISIAGEDPDAPIIKLINQIIGEAVRMRASDIHIEPMNNRVRVRYRIDGVCVERQQIPKGVQNSVLARLKLMSGIDIAERRLPQDGRIKMKISGKDIDFRVSSCPAYHGESVVLRVLRPDSVRVGIGALGFEEDNRQTFMKIIKRPNGIFLVTGPTGSGKTTTLYSALQELNRPDRKIITAEDPVEYNFPGINQCQVREEIGLTFSKILRSMLRQAPNIILVGEIRDLEVGEVAIQAALTGHLVFSTLHTNDAPSAVTRLIDMGIKPFLVASAVQAIMAQRLVRVICEDCKEDDPQVNQFMMRVIGLTPEELGDRKLKRGRGCKRCHETGFRGRLGIFELLTMNNELRELAFNRAPTSHIRKAAIAGGMRTLVEDGKIKVVKGITTVEEVARHAQAEGVLVDE
ncbi:MAG TPA: ATPase, T2SS/T4P/T4SS family [Phycisphaerae bacterium]|nr:ATPase, T2SS/T4P/T4SS family [Phycisphaerae bacterium]HOJ73497.1 ATPase, T2SS/T4P/T4SS family [Phycisphaerae bacterium]HOM51695.1 ATPase, T2SS/T4P/T4SS family [Phycisphaerae bacterium]HON66147.1 ATPase, T2SS/T4P/T4SS family [Phycisphaerae bacterium]HOQ86292.1 ATPase, T2SS/T4P/T4SS family [Phycisphaerae bacterium]